MLVLARPLVVLPWIWFSIIAIGFDRQFGSRRWQVVGIVYLAAMALASASVVSAAFSEIPVPDIDLLGLALAALLIGWVCHSIGLIVSPRRITRT